MKKLLLSAVVFSSLFATEYAYSGADSNGEVSINTASRIFTGALGSARHSADNTQFIGCSLFGTSVSCQARNSAGTSVVCSTSNATLIDTVKALSDDSRLYVQYNAAGTCTTINVYNFSYWKSR